MVSVVVEPVPLVLTVVLVLLVLLVLCVVWVDLVDLVLLVDLVDLVDEVEEVEPVLLVELVVPLVVWSGEVASLSNAAVQMNRTMVADNTVAVSQCFFMILLILIFLKKEWVKIASIVKA